MTGRPLPLPVVISDLGETITINRKPLDGGLGYFDPSNGEIAIAEGQDPFGERVILIHEALHLLEEMMIQSGWMKRHVNHKFIEGAAFGLAVVLLKAGALADVTADDFKAHAEAHKGER